MMALLPKTSNLDAKITTPRKLVEEEKFWICPFWEGVWLNIEAVEMKLGVVVSVRRCMRTTRTKGSKNGLGEFIIRKI